MQLSLLSSLRVSVVIMLILFCSRAWSHGAAPTPAIDPDRTIVFPDTENYVTVITDLHTHSVFSDGHVWPSVRVSEALLDGVDVLAITEHLEYQPHRMDIPHPDRNRAYEEAAAAAKGADLIVVRGSEITRNFPAGHVNAVFLTDANELIKVPNAPLDPGEFYAASQEWPAQAAIDAAVEQGAFLFWNHPFWTEQDRQAGVTAFHEDNAKAGKIHGIEVVNGNGYSEEAFEVALKNGLVVIGTSDVHNLIDWDYKPHAGGHRPVTLVLSKSRTSKDVREALFAKRTIAWFKNLLIGRSSDVVPLIRSSLSLQSEGYRDGTSLARVVIGNRSDATFELVNLSQYTFLEHGSLIVVPAHGEIHFTVKTSEPLENIDLQFSVRNALVAPRSHPEITLSTAL